MWNCLASALLCAADRAGGGCCVVDTSCCASSKHHSLLSMVEGDNARFFVSGSLENQRFFLLNLPRIYTTCAAGFLEKSFRFLSAPLFALAGDREEEKNESRCNNAAVFSRLRRCGRNDEGSTRLPLFL